MSLDKKCYEYVGVIHVHSKYSDGSGSIKKIIKEAEKANLDYIIINDHNNIKAKNKEGWYKKILLLAGEEIGDKGKSHYLALDIEKEINPCEYHHNTEEYIDSVKHQKGLGFIAHPFGLEKEQFHFRVSSWNKWENLDYTGMEIWSYMHDWSYNVNLFNIFYYYLMPDKAIDGPPQDVLQKWDQLCQKRRIVGIGSTDVHAKYIFPFFMFQFLSYRRVFKGIRTHIILPEPLEKKLASDKISIYKAFENGHCFFAYDYIADSKGFQFEAIVDDSKNIIMGDESKLRKKASLIAKSPIPSTIRLIKDGQLIKETDNSLQLYWETEEQGVYRIEAQYNGRSWVYTNPIYLR